MESIDTTKVLLGAVAVAATAAVLYAVTPAKAPNYSYSLEHQSRVLPGPERIHVSQFLAEGQPPPESVDGASTLYETFLQGAKVAGDGNCLGTRVSETGPYRWISYNQAVKEAQDIGAGMSHIGIKPKHCVGIYAANCTEWVLSEQGCNAFSLVTVPLYDTLGPDVVEYIVNQTSMELVFCQDNKLKMIFNVQKACPSIKHVVKFGEVTVEERTKAQLHGLNLLSLDELKALGQANPRPPVPPTPADIVTICYTSGTTGMPKGALLTHRNFVSASAASIQMLDRVEPISPETVHLSFLPLAHVFERMVQAVLFVRGSQIGFYQGNVLKLLDDLKELRPTIFPAVPRLLNRVHDKIKAGVEQAGGIKKFLFDKAYAAKKAEMERGVVRNNSFWDKLVFGKIQASLGGRVKILISGAAPLNKDVLTFLRVVLGCYVLEGYGQTESCAVSTFTLPGDSKSGQVGPPSANNQIKLVSVPEMNYFTHNDQGEICFYGPNVFVGYHNNVEKTKEALDEDGWLHSGDIGEWTPQGTLKIIDRKKNIFKLAQGEYIAPEKIENIYIQSPLVAQAYVHGDSLEASLVGIVIPDEQAVKSWADSQNIRGSFEEHCQNEVLVKRIHDDMVKLGTEKGLKGFEQVRAIHLHHEPMSIENGLLTPTFKAKRTDVHKRFSLQIESLYKKMPKA